MKIGLYEKVNYERVKDIVKEEMAKVWRSSVPSTTILIVLGDSDKEYCMYKNDTTEFASTDTSLITKSFGMVNIIGTFMINFCLMKKGNLKLILNENGRLKTS